MWNARLNEAQAGIKIAGRKINLRYADDTTVMAESKEEPKSLLMWVKEESEVDFKVNIQKAKIMASSLSTSKEIDGETTTEFIFLGWKITASTDCSHETIKCLLLGRKTMTNLNNLFGRRHHFADKGLYSQSYGFSSSHIQI